MPIARSTLTGVAAGVVLLAGALGLGVGLPEVIEDPGATTAELPTLPEQLDDRFVALQAITAEQGGATTPEQVEQFRTFTERSLASETEARESLGEQYGDAAVRAYLDLPDAGTPTRTAPAQIAVTVVPGEPGLLNPSGPFSVDESGAHYELEEIDGHRCAVIWNEPADPTTGMPTGQEPSASDYRVQCRTEDAGLTYDVFSTGLTPDEAVGYLELIVEKASAER